MKVILEIPDHIAGQLVNSPETLTRRLLETIAIEAYRKGLIGSGGSGKC